MRVKACLKRVFAIVIQRSQLALFCIVSENQGFPSQNAAAEALNQHVHISTSKGHSGCPSSETLKQLVLIPLVFRKRSF